MRLSLLLLPALALAAPFSAARAAIYSTSFAGTVTQQSGTTNGVGSRITGSFDYSTDSRSFLTFRIDGFSAVPPYTSSVSTVPAQVINPFEVLFQAVTNPTNQGGTLTRGFSLDLLANTNFNSANAFAVLTTPGLAAQLETQSNSTDGLFSSFTYKNQVGSAVTASLVAALDPNSLSTNVPEPASFALLSAPLLGLVLRRRR